MYAREGAGVPSYFFIKSSTSEVIALTPVFRVGSGFGGANELE